MKIYYFDIECLRDRSVFEEQLSIMPKYRKDKVNKLNVTADKLRSLAAGILIRFIRNEYSIDDYVETDKHGKPYFVNNKLKFNISHSGRYAILAISDDDIGIDIQAIKADKHRIAEKNFSKKECEYINQAGDDKQKQQRFCEIWTLKEAYLKNIGLGLRKPLNSFELVLDDDVSVKGKKDYKFKQFLMNRKYVVSVCYKDSTEELDIMEVGLA